MHRNGKWFVHYRKRKREQVNESGANMATSKSEQTSGEAVCVLAKTASEAEAEEAA